jgi:formate-dependent phosphoribosylglycinamide formyltransferase (GAR transformylase)
MSRLLIVGAGPLQVSGILAGQALGLEVIATDMNPQAPGAALADRFFVASTIDAEATTKVAEECRVDGVLTLGTDFPVRTVAAVAQRLGLPGLSPATAPMSPVTRSRRS